MTSKNIEVSVRHLVDRRDTVSGTSLSGEIQRLMRGLKIEPSGRGDVALITIKPGDKSMDLMVQGHLILPDGVSIKFPGNLVINDGGFMGTGTLNVAGSLWAKSVHAGALVTSRNVQVTGPLIAETLVSVAGTLMAPTGDWVLVRSGTLTAGIIDVGNVAEEKVQAENRASIRGGVLSAKHVAVNGKLHVGRGREGDVTGVCVETLEAVEIDSDASVAVSDSAKFGKNVFVMGDLTAKSMMVARPCNIAVRGSFVVSHLEARGHVTAAFDKRQTAHGLPQVLIDGPGTYLGEEFHGCKVQAFDAEIARAISERITAPVDAFVSEAIKDQYLAPRASQSTEMAPKTEAKTNFLAEMSL